MTVISKSFNAPDFDRTEILRYAKCPAPDQNISKLLEECINEIKEKLVYKICYIEASAMITDNKCDFGAFSVCSENLAKHLIGCKSTVIFGATIGTGIDRLITKYGHISPSKALMLQAIGAERIEALCDLFAKELSHENSIKLTGRFSPGYGDLQLSVQKDIFRILDCPKKIGLTLNDSLIMSPSKSVTAFMGICG